MSCHTDYIAPYALLLCLSVAVILFSGTGQITQNSHLNLFFPPHRGGDKPGGTFVTQIAPFHSNCMFVAKLREWRESKEKARVARCVGNPTVVVSLPVCLQFPCQACLWLGSPVLRNHMPLNLGTGWCE